MSSEELSSMIDRLSDRSDVLTASGLENILKWIFFSLAGIVLVLCLIFSSRPGIGVLAALFAAAGGVTAGYPNAIWELQKLNMSIIAHVDDATPTDFWSIRRKASYWLMIIIALIFFMVAVHI